MESKQAGFINNADIFKILVTSEDWTWADTANMTVFVLPLTNQTLETHQGQ